jgi:flavin-dependent dehydrogenase
MAEAERTAEYYRSRNESLGRKVLRGNSFACIPVRHPLSVMVANGYAAIGDSSFMAFPITGTGIANALSASVILATVIIKNKKKDYTASVLWEYQRDYFKKIGNGLAPVAKAKLLLTKFTTDDIDYIFDNGIITEKELSVSAEAFNIDVLSYFSMETIMRVKAIFKNKSVRQKLFEVLGGMVAVVASLQTMPKAYDEEKVLAWARKYDSNFKL